MPEDALKTVVDLANQRLKARKVKACKARTMPHQWNLKACKAAQGR
jgi:hypothetical protein